MTAVAARVAGAPISWGVCEVPGWGRQLDPATVLEQMREVGLTATELGPTGFLPDAPSDKAATLATYGLAAVAQFAPVVLHDPAVDPVPQVEKVIDGLIACGATTLVLAAATGVDGYELRPTLDDAGWATLLGNLDRLADRAAERGVVATLHPHVGTLVESGDDTDRVLAGSRIGLTLDTGHLLIGGGDPVRVAVEHPDRITHVHLKDVSLALARRVQAGELGYRDAVEQGLYVPLGDGDVDLAAIVKSLQAQGYSGWYVLEQDRVLGAAGAEGSGGVGAGGADAEPGEDVRRSVAHLLSLVDGPASGTGEAAP